MTDQPYLNQEANQPFFTIRDVVLEIRSDVKGLRETVDKLDNSFDSVKETQADHETRIRSVEKKLYLLAGAATVAGGSLGLISQFLGI